MRAVAFFCLLAACGEPDLRPGKACGPNRECPDGQFCSDENRCVPAGSDLSMPDLAPANITCTSNSDCRSGFCADGYCCDRACDGQCEACDITRGTCVQVANAQPHGSRSHCAGEGTACGGVCNSSGAACDYPVTTTACSSACATPASQTTYFCDGAGGCSPTGTTADCGGLTCVAGACRSACNTNSDCASGFACLGSACVVPRNCAEWQQSGALTDAEYVIDPDGTAANPSFSVWCANMGGTDMGVPLEYLTLPNTSTPSDVAAAIAAGSDPASSNSNFSLFAGGGSCGCSGNAIVAFQRVRLDVSNPAAIAVDVVDRTFATVSPEMTGCFATTGNCWGAPMIGWSEAGDCRGPASLGGEAQIDLRGTPFYLASTMFWDSWNTSVNSAPGSMQDIAPSRQVATVRAGGGCGVTEATGLRRVPLAFNTTPPPFVAALVNGDFTATPKLHGWTATGSASSFSVGTDANLGGRTVLSTGANVGTLSQTFVVPAEATRLYFAYAGTGGSVTLARVTASGDVTLGTASAPVSGEASTSIYAPAFWNIDAYAGQTLRITITTTASSSGLLVSGFDVLRGSIDTFVKNPGLLREGVYGSWTLTGTVASKLDNRWYNVLPFWSISTYDAAGGTAEGETGAAYQCITIPPAASLPGLRFSMTGGNQFVRLYDLGVGGACSYPPSSGAVLSEAGPSNNNAWAAKSWDLTPYGGHNALLAVEDTSTGGWGWAIVSEFFPVSATNGP